MIDIVLKDGQTGYDAVGEYIRRYWNRNIIDTIKAVGEFDISEGIYE